MPQVERPEETNELLLRFFAGRGPSRPTPPAGARTPAAGRRAGRREPARGLRRPEPRRSSIRGMSTTARAPSVDGQHRCPSMSGAADAGGRPRGSLLGRALFRGVTGQVAAADPPRRPGRARPRLHPRAAAADVARGQHLVPRRGARTRQHPRRGAGAARRQPLGRQHDPGHDRIHARVQHLLRRRASASTSSPTTSCCRCPGSGSLRKFGTVAASPRERSQGARLRRGAARLSGRRLRGPPPELGAQPRRLRRSQGLHPAGAGARRPDRPGRVDRRPGDRAVPHAAASGWRGCSRSIGCSA